MKVLVFCSPLSRAAEFRDAFAGSGHELAFACCSPKEREGVRFSLSQIYHLLRRGRGLLYLLALWAQRRVLLSREPLSAAPATRFLAALKPDLALHALGTIYRAPTITACGLGILNAHIGALPRYRGRSVMEWSLLCGDPTGVTVFFIDTGIDTGERLVLFEPIEAGGRATLDAAKAYLFAQDARLYRIAVDRVAAGAPMTRNVRENGLRFYEMSDLFRAALETQFSTAGQPAPGASSDQKAPGRAAGAA